MKMRAPGGEVARQDAAPSAYHFGMRRKISKIVPATGLHRLPLDATLLKPGLRLAVGLSGGADSVALLRALKERSGPLGLVLHAAHLHHGLRGEEADADLAFARGLAGELGLVFHEARVDTGSEAKADAESGKAGESIEEAARRLRYGWFRQLMASGEVDAVATAHTRDDQAETVLAKFLRGAWTEGLSGIHPVIAFPEGRILRPLLGATRTEVEAYLGELGQGWREDSTNRHLSYTRNRIRHELLPLLEGWNPRLREHLAQMAALARDEEAWWQGEMARLAAQFLLPGRPVRGGGRAAGDGLALDFTRLATLAPAVQRRLLRYAAEQLGAAPDFASTEVLRALALEGRAGQKLEMAQGLRAERTHRELRLAVGSMATDGECVAEAVPEYGGSIPGEIVAPAFGLRLRIEVAAAGEKDGQIAGEGSARDPSGAKAHVDSDAFTARLKSRPDTYSSPAGVCPQPVEPIRIKGKTPPADVADQTKPCCMTARLRNWRPGDRVRLRHSGGLHKVKEVLERLRITGSGRALWPVLEVDGRIVWMKGVELESESGIGVVAANLGNADEDKGTGGGSETCPAAKR
jgi:tRNA(Ile)-lysidine synthase